MTASFLSKTELNLIVEIFRNEISPNPIDSKRFRVLHLNNLDILNQLESNNYIIKTDVSYCLKIESLSLISKIETTAAQFLELIRPMYDMLRETYLDNPD
jgi:hypothetical protein